jgi:hypothetical protein
MAVAAQNRVDDSSSDIRIDSVLNNEYLIQDYFREFSISSWRSSFYCSCSKSRAPASTPGNE